MDIANYNIELLLADPVFGTDKLLEEFRNDKSQRVQYHQLLALKSMYNTAPDEKSKREIIIKLENFIKELLENNPVDSEPTIDYEDADPVAKKEYFLRKGSPRNLVLQVNNIFKTYKNSDFHLEDISISMRQGEITGVVGENGNGKTTLLRIIAGELLQDSGELNFHLFHNGEPIDDWGRIKSMLVYLPQELIRIPGVMTETLSYVAALSGFKDERNLLEVEYVVQRLNLGDHRHKTWEKLSGGYKLRFSLACLLLRKPRMLIMDEPLANLDIFAQNSLLNDLRALCDSIENPISMLFSSQHIEEVESVSDKILLLSKGKQTYYGLTEDIGKLRKQNTYEIKCRLLPDDLQALLANFPYTSLYNTGLSYLINTDLKVTMTEVMKYFSESDISLQSISDISNSTRRFLLKTGES